MLKSRGALYILISLVFAFWACESDAPEPANLPELRPLSVDEEALVHHSNSLALEALRRLDESHPEKNLCFSPLSVTMTMGMLYNGADGDSKRRIGEIIGFQDYSDVHINKTFDELTTFLNALDNQVQMYFANSFWYNDQLSINPLYRDMIMAYYGAEAEGLNFGKSYAATYINRILGSRINKELQFLAPGEGQDFETLMLNAGSFSGKWSFPISRVVEDHPFNVSVNSVKPHTFEVAENAVFQLYQDEVKKVVEAPFGNGQYSMVYILPEKSLNEVLESISYSTLEQSLHEALSARYNLYLPEIKEGYKTNLGQVLAHLDIPIDSRRLAGVFSDSRPQSVDRIIHAAYVDQSNKEIPAIAYYENVGQRERKFKIDKPFLYFIREKHTGILLFAGKFLGPDR